MQKIDGRPRLVVIFHVSRASVYPQPDMGGRMTELAERITVDPQQCGGRPCVRGMRVRVSDVLDLFAAGLTAEELLEEMPDLEPEDLQACLRLALSRSSGAGGVILWVNAQLSPSLAP